MDNIFTFHNIQTRDFKHASYQGAKLYEKYKQKNSANLCHKYFIQHKYCINELICSIVSMKFLSCQVGLINLALIETAWLANHIYILARIVQLLYISWWSEEHKAIISSSVPFIQSLYFSNKMQWPLISYCFIAFVSAMFIWGKSSISKVEYAGISSCMPPYTPTSTSYTHTNIKVILNTASYKTIIRKMCKIYIVSDIIPN